MQTNKKTSAPSATTTGPRTHAGRTFTIAAAPVPYIQNKQRRNALVSLRITTANKKADSNKVVGQNPRRLAITGTAQVQPFWANVEGGFINNLLRSDVQIMQIKQLDGCRTPKSSANRVGDLVNAPLSDTNSVRDLHLGQADGFEIRY